MATFLLSRRYKTGCKLCWSGGCFGEGVHLKRKSKWFKYTTSKKKEWMHGVRLRKLVRIPFLLKITWNSQVTPSNESIKKKITLDYFRYFRRILSVNNFDTEYYISLQISLLLNGITSNVWVLNARTYFFSKSRQCLCNLQRKIRTICVLNRFILKSTPKNPKHTC